MNAAIQNPKPQIANPLRVLICAGGTGGGIYPALTAAAELQKSDAHILWIGARGEMEETLVPRAGLKLETIRGGAIVGVPLYVTLMNGLKLAWSLVKAMRLVRRFRPEVMFMTGGYVAAPVTIAAWLHRVPIVIFQPDIEPGSSVRFALRFARKVACTLEGSRAFIPAEKIVVTGYPLRQDIQAATRLSKADALAQFDLTPDRPTLFVFGGSRGARNINRPLMGILPDLLPQVQVIHISGTFTWPEVEANAQALPEELRAYYRPYPYLFEEMGAAFRAADLVAARAGASMLGECPAFALPAILVPALHWGWLYQKVNADYLTERGAAVQLLDEELPQKLLPTALALLRDETKLAQMGQAAAALAVPDAAGHLAQVIREVGRGVASLTAVGAKP